MVGLSIIAIAILGPVEGECSRGPCDPVLGSGV